jgi:hypothetical protein
LPGSGATARPSSRTLYFAYALARRLPEGVSADAFNPGMVAGTALGRSFPAPVRFVARHILPHLTWLLRRVMTPNIRSAAESGGPLAWAHFYAW